MPLHVVDVCTAYGNALQSLTCSCAPTTLAAAFALHVADLTAAQSLSDGGNHACMYICCTRRGSHLGPALSQSLNFRAEKPSLHSVIIILYQCMIIMVLTV